MFNLICGKKKESTTGRLRSTKTRTFYVRQTDDPNNSKVSVNRPKDYYDNPRCYFDIPRDNTGKEVIDPSFYSQSYLQKYYNC